MQTIITCLALVGAILFAGCKKQEAVESQAPVGSETTETPVVAGPIEGIVHPLMTEQLHIFIREQGRMPASYQEFATARMDSPPLPPEGMEFVVDAATRQVKLVKLR